MNDADLVKAFRRGDRDAFSELVKRHMKPLPMTILRIVRDEEEARDISQAAFLKAYEGLPMFMRASSFKSRLYRIAINAAKDHLRRKRPAADTDLAERWADQGESPAQCLDRERLLKQLREAVSMLPEKQRITLQLRIYEEMDYREIAGILGGTSGAARANFFQAARKLRTIMETRHGKDRL
jgi:RNA polymerase sigma-70 factor (ECF subfamily)